MTVNDYPEFVEGQTLTAPELNELTTNLRYRDTVVARMVGFGINAGLGGSVTGSTLTIEPGLAIDQNGEPLFLEAAVSAGLPPTPASTEYPFIDGTHDGYSAVLEAYEDPAVAPACSETDCAGHAKVHTSKVRVQIVKGQITGSWMKFAGDDLLKLTPLEVDLLSNTASTGADLAAAIALRLRNGTGPELIPEASIHVLDSFIINATDIPGAKGYKAGWINMVLFAALDLVRAQALFGLDALHSASPPGVVLGWIHYDGSWKFDCSFRHAWEPPRGFSEAFFGGTCTNPFQEYEDELVGILNGYSPPVPPPASGTGGKPPVVVKCPKGQKRVNGKCYFVKVPPKVIDPHWYYPWLIRDPKVPIWNPAEDFTHIIDIMYDHPPLNFFDDGILGIVSTVGYDKDAATKAISDVITDGGDIATIVTMSAGETGKLPGYLPSAGASPSDTIVLTVDAANVVIATGRVAAYTSVKQAGTLVPQARAAVTEAREVAAQASAMQEQLTGKLAGYDAQFLTMNGSLNGIKEQMLTLQTGALSPGVMNQRIASLEAQAERLISLGDRVSTLEGKSIVKGVTSGNPVMGIDTAATLAEFAASTIEALKTVTQVSNRNFPNYLAAAERKAGEFEIASAAGDIKETQTAMLNLLDSLRTAVGAAGADSASKAKLNAQFRAVKEYFG